MGPDYGIRYDKPEIYDPGTDFTCDGHCSRCGACCAHHLGLMNHEIDRIHKYVKQHHIQPVRHGTPTADQASIDLVCPFAQLDAMGYATCLIYPIRPAICRVYQCNRSAEEIDQELVQLAAAEHFTLRQFISQRDEINIQQEFFPKQFTPRKNDIVVINQLHMMEHLKHKEDLFRYLGKTRKKDGRTEALIECLTVQTAPSWMDIAGLSIAETPETRSRR